MPLTTVPTDAQRGPAWTSYSVLGAKQRTFDAAGTPASSAWPTNNTAILIPFTVSFPVTFAETFFQAGTSPGTTNYDLGVYREDFSLIASLGATASVNTTDAILPVGGGAFAAPITLPRGRYYMAMSAASTTLTIRSFAIPVHAARAFGCVSMAAAHPLPTTITPATAVAKLPVLGLTTITNIL